MITTFRCVFALVALYFVISSWAVKQWMSNYNFGDVVSLDPWERQNGSQSTPPHTAPPPPPYLLIIVPTVPRKAGYNYLSQTLAGLDDEVPEWHHALHGRIHVVVVNNRPTTLNHTEFSNLRRAYANETDRFTFVDNEWAEEPPLRDNATAEAPPKEAYKPTIDVPNEIVQRQTLDIAWSYRRAMSLYLPPHPPHGGMESTPSGIVNARIVGGHRRPPSHVLMLEDDFVPCPRSILALIDAIGRLHATRGDWLTLRTSVGFNGVVFQWKDVSTFADYLERHRARRPPDHLLVEWFAGETTEAGQYKAGRPHTFFMYHLWDHVGVSSTLRKENSTFVPPGCWQPYGRFLFPTETSKSRQCLPDDLSPCPGGSKGASVWGAMSRFGKEGKLLPSSGRRRAEARS